MGWRRSETAADPLSLSLNLEANVVVRDADFARALTQRLDHLIEHSCREVPQPQERTAFGLEILNPASLRESE